VVTGADGESPGSLAAVGLEVGVRAVGEEEGHHFRGGTGNRDVQGGQTIRRVTANQVRARSEHDLDGVEAAEGNGGDEIELGAEVDEAMGEAGSRMAAICSNVWFSVKRACSRWGCSSRTART